MRFLIIATGYNCEQYVANCVKSVESQTYKEYEVIYVDDGSTDNTFEKIIESASDGNYVRVHENVGTIKAREKALEFYYEYLIDSKCDVIVWLDMDDQLMPHALETLAKVYEDENIWLTYGNYITDKGEQPFKNVEIPDHIHDANAYRQHPFMFMHLRSFKMDLYKKLNHADLYTDTGWAYQDANMLFSMMEMAGKEHIKAINDPLYIYTVTNPISVMNRFSHSERQKDYKKICSIKPKERIKSL